MAISTLRPDTPAQLADAVRWALSNEEPLEVRGRGSRRGLGRPVQAAHVLDLAGLSGVVAYEPEELILTVRGGTPLAEVLPLLADRNQHLAFEPPDLGPLLGLPAGGGTVGGLLACGLAGPRRIAAGSARDHLLGVEGVSGRGELYRSGAKVVKNVTGYDLPKLMAGSMGTLTAMTELTVKVLPAPEDTRTLLLAGLDEQAGVQALTRALQSPHDVSGAAHLPEAVAEGSAVAAVAGLRAAVTAVRLEGFGPSVAARAAALTAELGADRVLEREESLALWREIRDVRCFAESAEHHVWKLSVPPAAGPAVAEDIMVRLGDGRFYMDWGGGLIWLSVPPSADPAAIRAAVTLTGGHATLVRAPDAVRAAVDVFQPQPAPLAALAARVKESFDPKRVLNPGRIYAGV
ncbi:glycolate oxidase subunit GlcE [Azospirillum halopraeferens]|uniref:glycolate oxidase subunit GlcE n=1 Tax=Azospirillum halopraeferens TaxID=34010 RepID=UPI00040EB050|nr:glycolate oxidase subunit GlcE [Azospirillum halopraeferens]